MGYIDETSIVDDSINHAISPTKLPSLASRSFTRINHEGTCMSIEANINETALVGDLQLCNRPKADTRIEIKRD